MIFFLWPIMSHQLLLALCSLTMNFHHFDHLCEIMSFYKFMDKFV